MEGIASILLPSDSLVTVEGFVNIRCDDINNSQVNFVLFLFRKSVLFLTMITSFPENNSRFAVNFKLFQTNVKASEIC